MKNIDWDNAPEGAEFYACGCFRKDGFFFGTTWLPTLTTREQCKDYYSDYCERPQTQQKQTVITQEKTNVLAEADDIWEKSPAKASCYGGGRYWMFYENYNQWLYWDGRRWETNWIGDLPMRCADYSVRPQPKPTVTFMMRQKVTTQ